MKRLSRAFRYFWSYTVVSVTPGGITTFTHRLFRTPTVRFDKSTNKLQGKKYQAIFFDEIVKQETK